jgi:hypothetical protein
MRVGRAVRKQITRELIKPKYRTSHPVGGACYIAAEAVYHILGRGHGFKPMVGRVGNMTHWWLEKEGIRIDPTKSQFMHYRKVDEFYKAGRGCGFLTKEPSINAAILIDRVLSEMVLSNEE